MEVRVASDFLVGDLNPLCDLNSHSLIELAKKLGSGSCEVCRKKVTLSPWPMGMKFASKALTIR